MSAPQAPAVAPSPGTDGAGREGDEELPASMPDHAAAALVAPAFAGPDFLDRLGDALTLLTAHGADVVGALAALAAWQPRAPAPVPAALAAVGGLLEARLVARPEVEASALLAEVAAVRRLASAEGRARWLARRGEAAAARAAGASGGFGGDAGLERDAGLEGGAESGPLAWQPPTTRFGAAPTLEALNRERAVRRAGLLRAAAQRRQAARAAAASVDARLAHPFAWVAFAASEAAPSEAAAAPEVTPAAGNHPRAAAPVGAVDRGRRGASSAPPEALPPPEAVDDPFADALAFGEDGAFDVGAAFEATRAGLEAQGTAWSAPPGTVPSPERAPTPAPAPAAPEALGLLWVDSTPPEALAPSAELIGDAPWRPPVGAGAGEGRGGRTGAEARQGPVLADFDWDEPRGPAATGVRRPKPPPGPARS